MTQKLRYFCTLLLMAVVGVAWADDVTDVLNQSWTGVTGTSYAEKTGLKGSASDAVYAVQCAGGYESIQLRSNNSNSGVVTTTSGGKVKSITVEWNSNTSNGRTLNVYGKNTAYSSASDLYNSSNQGTLLGTIVCGTSTSLTIDGDYEYIGFRSASGALYLTSVTIVWEAAATGTVATTTAIDASGITNTDVYVSTEAGSLSATVTETESGDEVSGATVTWTSSKENVATVDENGVVTLVAAGTTTITASYAGVEDEYKASSATYQLTVTNSDPNAPGTENNPYTVAEALANTPASGTSANVYVRGIVSRFQNEGGIMEDGNNFRYYISDDGTTTSEIQVYKGKGLNNVAFSDNNDLLVGDEVVICGGLTTYNTTKEIAANNYIVSLNRPTPTDPTVTVSSTAVDVDAAEHDGTITVTCENMGENLDISVFFCEETDVTTPANYDWIDAEIDNQNDVYYVIEANTATEARKAYMVVKVADADAKEVYTSKLITFTQAGKELPSVTWDLSNDETATATTTEMSWTSDYATMLVEKAGSSTNTNNYYPGSATPRTSTRFYNGSELTIAPKLGYTITKVEFTATSANYASALSNSTWTNATAAVDDTNVTVTPTNGNLAMVATIGGTCGFTGVKVYYEESDVMVIKIKKDFTATTFSCDKALDFSAVEGITAFIITDEKGATSEVTYVPAGEGLYIVGAEGDYEVPFLANESEADPVTGNKLIPTDGTTEFKSDESVTYYVFGKQNGKEAFYKVPASGYTPSANKAVLEVNAPASSAKEMIVIGGDVTGIESIENGTIVNDNYYTIDGKLVKGQPTQKGIYVVNGRKVVIK